MSFTEFQLVLPSTDQLPCSDDIPVDNEDQNLLPNILLFLLGFVWSERFDWFFGVDMAVYHTTGVNPRVPGEYDEKLAIYQNLGVLYYAIYNPEYSQRDRHQPWEIYKLVNNT